MKTTLKAFANFSPRLRFGNPGTKVHFILESATLKGLRRRLLNSTPHRNSFRVGMHFVEAFSSPGFQGKPWAGISERFQR
jgi:hypothetical protein